MVVAQLQICTLNLRRAGFLPVKLGILDHTDVQTPAYSCGILDDEIYTVCYLKVDPTSLINVWRRIFQLPITLQKFLLHIQGRT